MERLNRKKIAIDSMLLIYLLENNASYVDKVGALLEQAGQLVCSAFLLAEVCAGFYRSGQVEKVEVLRRFLEDNSVDVVAFDEGQALVFAKIRGLYSFSSPDCIHLAAAISAQADFFVSNDQHLKGFKELPILQLNELE